MASHYLITLFSLLLTATANSCNLNEAEPVTANLAAGNANDQPRRVLLSNNVQLELPEADGVLKIHSADSFMLIDQLTDWPTATGQINSIKAQPVVLDHNYDGRADAVYAVDSRGLLWFVTLSSRGFEKVELLADFSDTQARFTQPLQLVQMLAPGSGGSMQQQTMLLLTATMPAGDLLLAVKHQRHRQSPLQLTDLIDRTAVSADEQRYGIAEQLWQQIQQGAGWYIQLEQRLTAVPQVYAGVIYLTSAAETQLKADCSLADGAVSQLYAVHLHHAGLVYARRQWDISAIDNAELVLQKNSSGELELSLQHEQQQQLLLTDLKAITDECADCVAPLTAVQFPATLRLATYQTEQGAH
jgi:hypothetical protein